MAKHITDFTAAASLSGPELLEVSQLSTVTRISAATISAAAADNSLNDSANGFVTAGFAVGDRVNVSGFTAHPADNVQVGTVASVVAGKIVLSGVVLVDNVAGDTVVISKWVTFSTTPNMLAGLAPFAGWASKITPAALAANTNDYAPANLATSSRLRISASAAINLTGLSATGVTDGRTIILSNVGTFTITLKAENAGSAAANRFTLASDLALAAGSTAMLIYDSVTTRWKLVGSAPSAGTALAAAADVQAGTSTTEAVTPNALVTAAAKQTLTDGATIAWDMSIGFNAKVTLGGNRTLGTPTNPHEGLSYALEVLQDATGTRTMTWPASFDWGSAGAPTLSTAAGKRDIIFLYCYDAAGPSFRASFNKSA